MVRKVIFLCPHNAAKSVMAAAYCLRTAQKVHLSLMVDSAGTEPSEHMSPAVAEVLRAEGIEVGAHQPRRVTATELAEADYIVSLGCDLAEFRIDPARVLRWDDVPAPSQNLAGAQAAILAHVAAFIDTINDQES